MRIVNMRTPVLVMVAAVLVLTRSGGAAASRERVTGQLIDLACYAVDKGNTGNVHKGRGYTCAQACAKEGFAVGLLTSGGKIYQVTGGLAANANAKLGRHMGHTVAIDGDVGEKDGVTTIAADTLEVLE
jgi:hypothetical protein